MKKYSKFKINQMLADLPLTDACAALACAVMARAQFHSPENILSVFTGLIRLIREMGTQMNTTQRVRIAEWLRDCADTLDHALPDGESTPSTATFSSSSGR